MGGDLVVYESALTRERIALDSPLTDRADDAIVRKKLGLPRWLDMSDEIVRRAVVALWAARSRLDELGLPGPKLFGGAAFRVICPSTNRADLFRRELKDIDYLIAKRSARMFIDTLTGMHATTGSAYFHFVTEEDRRFNNLRAGLRHRLRVVVASEPRVVFVDILVDGISFCHRLETGPVIEDDTCVLPLALLVLTKLQFITAVPARDVGDASAHRRLGELRKGMTILGMEDKDICDVAAAFFDHEPGSSSFPEETLLDHTSQSWALSKTVVSNLRNRRGVSHVLGARGLPELVIETVLERMEYLANKVEASAPRPPRIRLGSRAWWEEVDE